MTTMELIESLTQEIECAIRAATAEVFSVMLGIDITPGEPQIGCISQDHSGVVAVLGLTGDWAGSGQLSVDPSLALQIASRLLMADCAEIEEDVLDAIAEVSNMIIGNVKNALELSLGAMKLSTPAVIFGGSFETRVVGTRELVLVPFSCAEGSMRVQIVIAPGSPSFQNRLPNGKTLGVFRSN
jgi:chemotaxis protein CheX